MSASETKPEQLRLIKCLSRFNDEELKAFLEFVELAACGENVVLFEQGDIGDCMYFIAEGQLRVFTRKKGNTVTLKVLEAGDAFGDIALFNQTPRLAGVEALRDSRLLRLTAANLEKLAAKNPGLSAKFLQCLAISQAQMYRDFH